MSYFNTLLFGVFPYIAIAVFVIASLLRYGREQYTWKTSSSQFLESKRLRVASYFFHIGVIGILGGHFVGLLTPSHIWHMLHISAEFKQLMAISLGGIFGIICFIGLTMLLHRRLTNPRVRALSSNMDITILVMLYAQLILGLISILFSLSHMDGSVMLLLMEWVQSIATFRVVDAVNAIETVGLIYKLHILLGMTIVLMFPFSRLVHIISVPIKYVKRNYQVVRG